MSIQPYTSFAQVRERADDMRENVPFYKQTADRVNAIAQQLVDEGYGFGRKAFIKDIADALNMPLRRLAGPLIVWNNLGWIELNRSDLRSGLDNEKRRLIQESEIILPGEMGEVHFVVAPQDVRGLGMAKKRQKKNPFSPAMDPIKRHLEEDAGMQEAIAENQADRFRDATNFISSFDHGGKRAQEQYAEGRRIGELAVSVSIGVNDVWGAKMKDGGSLQSYEKIGYHAYTADLLRGFLDSGVPIFVYRWNPAKDGKPAIFEFKIQ